jgi:hypothetical protein
MHSVGKRRRNADDTRAAKEARLAPNDAPTISLDDLPHDALVRCVLYDGGLLPHVPHGTLADMSPHDPAGWALPPPEPFRADAVAAWLHDMEGKTCATAANAVALKNVYSHPALEDRGKVFTVTPVPGGSRVQVFARTSTLAWRGGVIDATAVPRPVMRALAAHHAAAGGAMQVVCSTCTQVKQWAAVIRGVVPAADVQCVGNGADFSRGRPFVHRPGVLQFCLTTLDKLALQPRRCPVMDAATGLDYDTQGRFARVVVFTHSGVGSVRAIHRFLFTHWTAAPKFLVFTNGGVADMHDARDALEIIDARIVNVAGEALHDSTRMTGAGMAAVMARAHRRFLRGVPLQVRLCRYAVRMPSSHRILAAVAGKRLDHMGGAARFTGATVQDLVQQTGIHSLALPAGGVAEFVAAAARVVAADIAMLQHAATTHAALRGTEELPCCVCMGWYEPRHMAVTPCLHYACLACTVGLCRVAYEADGFSLVACPVCRQEASFRQLFVCHQGLDEADPRAELARRLLPTAREHALRTEAGLSGPGCDARSFKTVAWCAQRGFVDPTGAHPVPVHNCTLAVVTRNARAVPALLAAAQRAGVHRLYVHVVDWAGDDAQFSEAAVREFCERWEVACVCIPGSDAA